MFFLSIKYIMVITRKVRKVKKHFTNRCRKGGLTRHKSVSTRHKGGKTRRKGGSTRRKGGKTRRKGGKGPRKTGVDRLYYDNGNVYLEDWYKNGKSHREGGKPASTMYGQDGNIINEQWLINDKFHRVGGPANVNYYPNGNIINEQWFLNGNLHREGGPAETHNKYGYKYWYKNGKRHREDGPAEISYDEDGTITWEDWYLNGKLLTEGEVIHGKKMKKTMKQLSHATKMHTSRPILRRKIPEEMVREIGKFV